MNGAKPNYEVAAAPFDAEATALLSSQLWREP